MVKNGNFKLLLTSSGQEWLFHIANLVFRNGNLTLLLTSSGQEWQMTLLLTSSGEEWQFHTATDN